MNLLGIYTVGVARCLCRRLLLDIVIVKLSIAMALSTTFTQYAPELPNSVKKYHKIRIISLFTVIQGHRFW